MFKPMVAQAGWSGDWVRRHPAMAGRALAFGLIAVSALIVVAIYARRLADSPIYLAHDEVVFAVNAHALAATGRDVNGVRSPLYFHIGGDFWATPVNIYFSALLFKLLPVSDATIRVPSVIVGLLVVVLTYMVARRIHESRAIALVTASLLALTPALFIHSRMGTDHLYPLPFMLAWLWCLLGFLEQNNLRLLVAAAFCLGLGAYTYLGSLILMPVYLVVTGIAIAVAGLRSPLPYVVALVAFIVPVAPLIAWFAMHPAQYSAHVAMYNLYDAARLTPLEGLRRLLGSASLVERWDVYYGYFNPSFLFFAGDPSLINSTRYAGVFLLPIAVLLPAGIYQLVRSRPRVVTTLVLVGFLASPLAGALIGEQHRVNRALVMLPFAILLAGCGVEYLLANRTLARQTAAVCLLCAVPVQFVGFYRDYLTGYRVRSAYWFEGNIRGAIEEVLALDVSAGSRSPNASADRKIYLSTTVPWIEWYWRLYLIEHAREDLLKRTVLFNPKEVDPLSVRGPSLVLADVHDLPQDAFRNRETKARMRLIGGPNQDMEFAVLER